MQLRHNRVNHWVFLCGCTEAINGERTLRLPEDEGTYVRAHCKQRLSSLGRVAQGNSSAVRQMPRRG